MTNKFIILFFFLISACHTGKRHKNYIRRDESLFEKAMLLQNLEHNQLNNQELINVELELCQTNNIIVNIQKKLLLQFIKYYQEIIENYSKSEYYFPALENKANAEIKLGDTENAKLTLLKIVNSHKYDAKNKYTRNKYDALNNLARLLIIEKKYQQAVTYLDLAKNYSNFLTCLNDLEQTKLNRYEMYGISYWNLGDTTKALKALIPHILNNEFADNSSLITVTINLLNKIENNQKIRNRFEESFNTYYSKSIEQNKNTIIYFIKFYDIEIQIEPWFELLVMNEDERKKAIKTICSNSHFNQLLRE